MDLSWKIGIISLSILSLLSFVFPHYISSPLQLVHFVLGLYHSVGAERGLMRDAVKMEWVVERWGSVERTENILESNIASKNTFERLQLSWFAREQEKTSYSDWQGLAYVRYHGRKHWLPGWLSHVWFSFPFVFTTVDKVQMTIWIKQGDKQKHPGKCFIYVAIISVIIGIDLFLHRLKYNFIFCC